MNVNVVGTASYLALFLLSANLFTLIAEEYAMDSKRVEFTKKGEFSRHFSLTLSFATIFVLVPQVL